MIVAHDYHVFITAIFRKTYFRNSPGRTSLHVFPEGTYTVGVQRHMTGNVLSTHLTTALVLMSVRVDLTPNSILQLKNKIILTMFSLLDFISQWF